MQICYYYYYYYYVNVLIKVMFNEIRCRGHFTKLVDLCPACEEEET